MATLPIDLSKARAALGEVAAMVERPADIVLAGDTDLVALAKDRFADGGGPTPAVLAESMAGLSAATTHPGEVLIILVPPEREAAVRATIDETRIQGGVIIAVDDGSQATGAATRLSDRSIRLSFRDSSSGWSRLFVACAEIADHDLIALGRRYPTLRAVAAQRTVNHTAAQNALIGLLVFLPGADMPAMTMNQLKMVLYLAGIYGEEIGLERAIELITVATLGFGFRRLARRLVGLVPGFGWLVKGIFAYTSTSAVGSAAIKYFQSGSPASTSRVMALAGKFRS